MKVIYQVFELNQDDGYFDLTLSSEPGFIKLTGKLKIEDAHRQSYKNYGVEKVIRSKKMKIGGKGKHVRVYHNGLIPTYKDNVFIGDHREWTSNKKSTVLFEFSPDGLYLMIHFILGYKVYPKHRNSFVSKRLECRSRMEFVQRWLNQKTSSEVTDQRLKFKLM